MTEIGYYENLVNQILRLDRLRQIMAEISSPLIDVIKYEGVLNSELEKDIVVSDLHAQSVVKATRWEILGLPGMGKSSICKTVFQRAKGHFPVLVLPEAAEYAVKVKGLALIEFEPFLNIVYRQAEEFARKLAISNRDLVIIREPSIIQNEVYLIVQKGYQNDPGFRATLTEMARYVEEGLWDLQTSEKVSLKFIEQQERLLDLVRGPWWNGYAILTTGDPIVDVGLSIRRQQNADRDPRLMTNNLALLCGYSIGISKCVQILRERGSHMLTLDSEDRIDELSLKLINSILTMRGAVNSRNTP